MSDADLRKSLLDRQDSMRARIPRIAIIGTGYVGSTTAHALLMSGISAEIVLIDRDPRRVTGSRKIPMAAVLRTRTLPEMKGFMKSLISAESDEILGFMAVGTQAGEIMSIVQTAMMAKLPYTELRDAIFTHPAMAEGLTVLFATAPALAKTAVVS